MGEELSSTPSSQGGGGKRKVKNLEDLKKNIKERKKEKKLAK